MRIFGTLLLLVGVVGTAFFSYFAFVEGSDFAERDKRKLTEQQKTIETLELERQKSGNSKEANADLEKKYTKALELRRLYLASAADNKDFYKRQTLFAIGSSVIFVVGLLILILSSTGRGKKSGNVSLLEFDTDGVK